MFASGSPGPKAHDPAAHQGRLLGLIKRLITNQALPFSAYTHPAYCRGMAALLVITATLAIVAVAIASTVWALAVRDGIRLVERLARSQSE